MPRPSATRVLRCMALLVCGASLLAAGCVGLPKSVLLKRERFSYNSPRDHNQLSWEETVQICGAVTSLRAEPSILYVRRNDQIGVVDHIQTSALDSSGRSLGEPRVIDWKITGRSLQILRDGDLLGRRTGETDLVLSFPTNACPKQSTPIASAIVTVVVGDTGTTSPMRMKAKP